MTVLVSCENLCLEYISKLKAFQKTSNMDEEESIVKDKRMVTWQSQGKHVSSLNTNPAL